jgi:hypothetical protein
MDKFSRRMLIGGAATAAGAFIAERSLAHHKSWHQPVATPTPTSTPTPTPVPSVLDLSAFPYNYKTGPLGSNNVLPASNTGALFGMWSGLSTAGGADGQRAYLVDHIADTGRSPDIIGCQEDTYTFGGTSNEDWIYSLGAVPVVGLGEGGGSSMYHGFTSAQILAGDADADLTTMANRYGAKSYRIMVSPAREFWPVLAGTPTLADQTRFVDAWKYMVEFVAGLGADNVGWYWTPGETAGGGEPSRTIIDNIYPGHAYVDWVGSTGYCQDRVGVNNTPWHDQWAEFREIFSYGEMYGGGLWSIAEIYGPQKPYVVAETGCLYSNTGVADRKRDWFKNIDDVAKPNMPNLRGVIYFGQALTADECFVDWRAYSNARAQDNHEHPLGCANGVHGTYDANTWSGYTYWASRPRWNVGVLGGA